MSHKIHFFFLNYRYMYLLLNPESSYFKYLICNKLYIFDLAPQHIFHVISCVHSLGFTIKCTMWNLKFQKLFFFLKKCIYMFKTLFFDGIKLLKCLKICVSYLKEINSCWSQVLMLSLICISWIIKQIRNLYLYRDI